MDGLWSGEYVAQEVAPWPELQAGFALTGAVNQVVSRVWAAHIEWSKWLRTSLKPKQQQVKSVGQPCFPAVIDIGCIFAR